MRQPRFGSDLRKKALLALEEATHDSRYRRVPRTYLLRFALAYLWSISSGDRDPFRRYWTAIDEENELFRHQHADRELVRIYGAVGIKRCDDDDWAMWHAAQCQAERRREDR